MGIEPTKVAQRQTFFLSKSVFGDPYQSEKRFTVMIISRDHITVVWLKPLRRVTFNDGRNKPRLFQCRKVHLCIFPLQPVKIHNAKSQLVMLKHH